ncbi:MAG: CHRD domain-containing protein [Phormidesmis sp.]
MSTDKQKQKMSWVLGLAAIAVGVGVPTAAWAGHTNTILHTMLDGSSEVSEDGDLSMLVGDANGMGEAYVFGIDGDETTLCYSVFVSGIQTVPVGEGMAAHVHEGVRGENGPVVAALAGPEDGDAADCLTEGEEGKFPTGETGIVQRILDNPEDFYVNVHNPLYPNGAIRGQLQSMNTHAH